MYYYICIQNLVTYSVRDHSMEKKTDHNLIQGVRMKYKYIELNLHVF